MEYFQEVVVVMMMKRGAWVVQISPPERGLKGRDEE